MHHQMRGCPSARRSAPLRGGASTLRWRCDARAGRTNNGGGRIGGGPPKSSPIVTFRSPYDELGVGSGASTEEIKLAYRRLARLTHPDVNPGSASRFRRVNAAYRLLSDSTRRAAFDRGVDWEVGTGACVVQFVRGRSEACHVGVASPSARETTCMYCIERGLEATNVNRAGAAPSTNRV